MSYFESDWKPVKNEKNFDLDTAIQTCRFMQLLPEDACDTIEKARKQGNVVAERHTDGRLRFVITYEVESFG